MHWGRCVLLDPAVHIEFLSLSGASVSWDTAELEHEGVAGRNAEREYEYCRLVICAFAGPVFLLPGAGKADTIPAHR